MNYVPYKKAAEEEELQENRAALYARMEMRQVRETETGQGWACMLLYERLELAIVLIKVQRK